MISYGMFDQIRVDNSINFYLMLGMQELHKELRRNQNISSYRQTQSRKILCIVSLVYLLVCFPVGF